MSIASSAKRLTYLIHRWTGVGACLLMALWFVSGIVMLFIGYPKLTPWERLGALPALRSASCCVPVAKALETAARVNAGHAQAASASDVSHGHSHVMLPEIVLTSIRNQPYYRFRFAQGAYITVDARTGKVAAPIDEDLALSEAQSFLPGAHGRVIEKTGEDRWTHSGALNAHRPLYAVQMDDALHTRLYVSSVTGQTVMDAPRIQRLWNYAGAWLHWLYMLRDRPSDPVWSWAVIILSAFGTITALTGTLAGIWRWRFSGRYKSGSHSPYRESYLRWHHICGLLFAGLVCTWIFSGLMSMNPFGIFSAQGARPDVSAYRKGDPMVTRLDLDISHALNLLEQDGFSAVELEWRVLGGQPWLLARDAGAGTRIVTDERGQLTVGREWEQSRILQAADRLLGAPIVSVQKLDHYDAYYYGRAPEAMNGASEKCLPVLRLEFGDQGNTWVHLDLQTADMESSLDRSQRIGRWLFNFLHSWDLPVMLQAGPWREVLLILLSAGGLVISITGVVIGYRRLTIWMAPLRSRVARMRLAGQRPAAWRDGGVGQGRNRTETGN